jgi:histidinol dehydrogenase
VADLNSSPPPPLLLLLLLLVLVLQVRDREEAARISNAYAPEHLIINVEDPEGWLPLLDNAGSIFMGRWAMRTFLYSAFKHL